MKPDSARYYPEEIENWWVDKVNLYFKTKDNKVGLAKIREYVQYLSDHFTTDREDIGVDYGRKEYFLLAYGIFFFPQTWARIRYPLKELLEVYQFEFSKKGPIHIADIGAGTGSAFLSAIQLLRAKGITNPIHIDAIDHSRNSLELAKTILQSHRSLFGDVKLKAITEDCKKFIKDKATEKGDYHLVIASFSLNEVMPEMTLEKADQTVGELQNLTRPKGITLILEPALKETAERLQSIRDKRISEKTSFCWGPYPNQSPCPFLEKAKFWNHEVRIWDPPQSLKHVNTTLWRSIKELKFSYIALSRVQPNIFEENDSTFRIVSPISKKKGKYLIFGISAKGNHCSYDFQMRDMSSEEKKEFKSLERGDILKISNMAELGQVNCYRIPNFSSISAIAQIR